MEPMLAAFEQELAGIRFTPPKRALISNVTGRLAGAEVASVDYWCEHVVAPVRFAEGIATAASHGASTFLELGPRPTLIGMGRQCLPDPALAWWPSLRPAHSDWAVILSSLAELHRSGHRVDWRGFHRPFAQRRVALPGYPFQRQRYWWSPVDPAGGSGSLWLAQIKDAAPASPLASWAPVDEAGSLKLLALPGGQERRLQTWLTGDAPAELADHRIRDQVVFPAAGFIQLALQAVQELGHPLHLAQLELDQPLRLQAQPCELQVLVGERLEWHSRSAGQNDWRCHGHWRWQPDSSGLDPAAGTVWQAPGDAAVALDLPGFYAALASFGLVYGPAFRCLERLLHQGHEAWAWLRRPSGAADWSLLDGCFQAVAATLDPRAASGQLLLPVGLASLQLQSLPLPEHLRCRVHLQASDEPAFVLADLELYEGEDGPSRGPIGTITGFRLRRLPRQALDWLFPLAVDTQPQPVPVHQRWLLQSSWQSLPERPPAQPPADLLLLWPDLAEAPSLLDALRPLLTAVHDQPADRPIWLVIEGEGPLQGGLAGFARTAALERPSQQWLRIHVPQGYGRESLPLSALAAYATQEPALAWDGAQLSAQRLGPLPPERFRLGIRHYGVLESLVVEPTPVQHPGPGELELAVDATGLNFRDVLNALGVLRRYSRQLGLDQAARVPFGGECVGRVTAVGAGVDPALVGQRMLAALAVGSLASHVLARAELCVPWPEQLPVELGASLSTAFLTALYGLRTLARLEPGETVLIHAAAGGVGQAAVQVAQRLGARVLATASAAKQAVVLKQGVEAVFDSRSLDFSEQVRAATGGRGVDVVLNSLKGDWVDASFAALAEGGRFLELGKIEIWTREQAATERPDASYLPFDLLEVAGADPAAIRALLQEFLRDFQSGHYRPLPLQSLPLSQAEEAFRRMAQGRHTGKLVITHGERAQPHRISPDSSLLVTGALGGIGLRLLPWLVAQGAKELVLVSRSIDHPSPQAQRLLDQLRQQGVRLWPVACDLGGSDPIAQADQLAQLKAVLRQAQPLAGVLHAAGVLDDGLIDGQTPARLSAVLAPKWRGWQWLEPLLEQSNPRPWVVHFSSLASLLGSPGQVAYGAANGALDGLASSRADHLAIQWGPWAEGGMAAALDQRQQQRLAAFGLRSLPSAQALEALGDLLRRGKRGVVAVVDADWQRLAAQAGTRQAAPLQDLLALDDPPPAGQPAPECPAYLGVLDSTPAAERPQLLQAFVREQLAKVMGLADADQIDASEPLFNMGLDSLMALELMVLLEQHLGIRLTEALVFEHPTIEALVRFFLAELFPQQQGGVPSHPPEPGPKPVASLDGSADWQRQLAAVAELDEQALLRQLRNPNPGDGA